jgi:hypothetical protein
METMFAQKKDNEPAAVGIEINDFKEKVRESIHSAIKIPLDEELQKASLELQEEQRKAI